MESTSTYNNIYKLENGMKLQIRSLNNGDHEDYVKFIQQTPEEILQFCKLHTKDQGVSSLLDLTKAHRGIPLLALDLATKKPIGSIYLEKGHGPALKIGEIQQLLVSQHLQGIGLGSLLLDTLIYLASKENLHWLKVEVVTEMKQVTRAFESRGFKVRAFLEDYFTDLQGRMYDVALMVRPLLEDKLGF